MVNNEKKNKKNFCMGNAHYYDWKRRSNHYFLCFSSIIKSSSNLKRVKVRATFLVQAKIILSNHNFVKHFQLKCSINQNKEYH